MRQQDGAWGLEPAGIDVGLALIHIQSHPAEEAQFQPVDGGILIQQSAPGRVDDDGTPGQLFQCGAINQAAGMVGQGAVERQHGTAGEQLRQGQSRGPPQAVIDLAAVAFAVPEERCHIQGRDAPREGVSDRAATQDAAGLAREAGTQQLVRCPAVPVT